VHVPSIDPETPAVEQPNDPPRPDSSGRITVVAVEYAFGNMPTTIPPGTTLALRNDGREVHEMIVMRRHPGVAESFDQLLRMPPGEADDRMSLVGDPLAEPGRVAEETVTLDEAGDYLMICYIPVGMTSLPAPGEEPQVSPDVEPHAARGMVLEFVVQP
jgi:plastocyanin